MAFESFFEIPGGTLGPVSDKSKSFLRLNNFILKYLPKRNEKINKSIQNLHIHVHNGSIIHDRQNIEKCLATFK